MKENRSRGGNFNYRELEDYLFSHPAVLEVAVVPGLRAEREVGAFVVPKPGVFDPDRLEAYFLKKLKSIRMEGFVEYRESLPKSGTGKLYRRELIKEARLRQG